MTGRGVDRSSPMRRADTLRSIADSFRKRVEDGHSFVLCPTFAGRHASDDLRAVGYHLPRVKRAFFSSYSLHDDSRVLINQYAQFLLLCS